MKPLLYGPRARSADMNARSYVRLCGGSYVGTDQYRWPYGGRGRQFSRTPGCDRSGVNGRSASAAPSSYPRSS